MSRQSRRSTLAILFLLSEESKAALCLSSQVENSLVTPYHVLTNDYKGSKTWQQQQRRGHPNLSTTTTDRPPSSIPRQGSSQASKFSFLNVFWIVLTLSIFRMRGIFSIVMKQPNSAVQIGSLKIIRVEKWMMMPRRERENDKMTLFLCFCVC